MINDEIMEAIEQYAQTRHTHGSYLYNLTTSHARSLLVEKMLAMDTSTVKENTAQADPSIPAIPAIPAIISAKQIEGLAVKHEDFGFGSVDAQGCTTHGFGPDGLIAFARELLSLNNNQQEIK